MSAKNVLDGVAKFCEAEPWPERLAATLRAHTETACAATGTPPETLQQRLGEGYPMLFTCVLEDFMTQPDSADAPNVTSAYLKRHGWKLGATARRQLEAVRDSVMGLYEIIGVRPGEGLELRDVLLEEYEAQIYHPGLAQVLPVGAMLGARLLRGGAVIEPSGGILPFEPGHQTEGVAEIRAAAGVGDSLIEPDRLAALAPHITNFWLKKTLQEALQTPFEKPTADDNAES